MKFWIKGLVVLGAGIILGGVGWYAGTKSATPTASIQVAATFFPLADLAREVGGDEVMVTQIVPDGVEPHDYEPSADDVAQILSADIVVMNGGGVDAWAEKLTSDIEQAGGIVVRMSDVVPFIAGSGEADEEGELPSAFDPHAWLDAARMQELAKAVAEALITKDEAHAARYATRADSERTALAELDARYKKTLQSCKTNTILVTHNAFRYWGLRYNLEVEGVSGITPEAEPSVQDLANLVEKAKDLGVTTVFFESPASTALAQTLAQEIGASVDVLSPLEGRTPEEIAEGATYFTIMEHNLAALSRALACTP